MSKLTTKKRNALRKSSFAMQRTRRYPINDRSHARNALSRVAQFGTPEEVKQVRRAVHEKYPDLAADAKRNFSEIAAEAFGAEAAISGVAKAAGSAAKAIGSEVSGAAKSAAGIGSALKGAAQRVVATRAIPWVGPKPIGEFAGGGTNPDAGIFAPSSKEKRSTFAAVFAERFSDEGAVAPEKPIPSAKPASPTPPSPPAATAKASRPPVPKDVPHSKIGHVRIGLENGYQSGLQHGVPHTSTSISYDLRHPATSGMESLRTVKFTRPNDVAEWKHEAAAARPNRPAGPPQPKPSRSARVASVPGVGMPQAASYPAQKHWDANRARRDAINAISRKAVGKGKEFIEGIGKRLEEATRPREPRPAAAKPSPETPGQPHTYHYQDVWGERQEMPVRTTRQQGVLRPAGKQHVQDRFGNWHRVHSVITSSPPTQATSPQSAETAEALGKLSRGESSAKPTTQQAPQVKPRGSTPPKPGIRSLGPTPTWNPATRKWERSSPEPTPARPNNPIGQNINPKSRPIANKPELTSRQKIAFNHPFADRKIGGNPIPKVERPDEFPSGPPERVFPASPRPGEQREVYIPPVQAAPVAPPTTSRVEPTTKTPTPAKSIDDLEKEVKKHEENERVAREAGDHESASGHADLLRDAEVALDNARRAAKPPESPNRLAPRTPAARVGKRVGDDPTQSRIPGTGENPITGRQLRLEDQRPTPEDLHLNHVGKVLDSHNQLAKSHQSIIDAVRALHERLPHEPAGQADDGENTEQPLPQPLSPNTGTTPRHLIGEGLTQDLNPKPANWGEKKNMNLLPGLGTTSKDRFRSPPDEPPEETSGGGVPNPPPAPQPAPASAPAAPAQTQEKDAPDGSPSSPESPAVAPEAGKPGIREESGGTTATTQAEPKASHATPTPTPVAPVSQEPKAAQPALQSQQASVDQPSASAPETKEAYSYPAKAPKYAPGMSPYQVTQKEWVGLQPESYQAGRAEGHQRVVEGRVRGGRPVHPEIAADYPHLVEQNNANLQRGAVAQQDKEQFARDNGYKSVAAIPMADRAMMAKKWDQARADAEIAHAKGVRAAKDLGGQVPQKFVNEADRTLAKHGEIPSTHTVRGKLTKDKLRAHYATKKPVVGDTWNLPDGSRAELSSVEHGSWGTSIGFQYIGKKRGYHFTVTVPNEPEPPATSGVPRQKPKSPALNMAGQVRPQRRPSTTTPHGEQPSASQSATSAQPEKSKGHIGFTTDPASGTKYELYREANGDLYRAPISSVMDVTTGNRQGRWEAKASQADARARHLMEMDGPAQKPVAEPQGTTKPAANPATPNPRPPEPMTRSEAEKQLIKYHEDMGGGYTAQDERELNEAAGAGNAFTFHRKLPTEIVRGAADNGIPPNVFRVTNDPSEAGGADAFAELGDRYFNIIAAKYGSPINAALKTAENSNDPAIRLAAAVYRTANDQPSPAQARAIQSAATRAANALKKGKTPSILRARTPDERARAFRAAQANVSQMQARAQHAKSMAVGKEHLDTSKLSQGDTIAINGHHMEVVTDDDGEEILRDSGILPDTPVAALHGTPLEIDKGSHRKSEPPFSADTETAKPTNPSIAAKPGRHRGFVGYFKQEYLGPKEGAAVYVNPTSQEMNKIMREDSAPSNMRMARVTVTPHGDIYAWHARHALHEPVEKHFKISGVRGYARSHEGRVHLNTQSTADSATMDAYLKAGGHPPADEMFASEPVDNNRQLGLFAKTEKGEPAEVGEKVGQVGLFGNLSPIQKPKNKKPKVVGSKRANDPKNTMPMFSIRSEPMNFSIDEWRAGMREIFADEGAESSPDPKPAMTTKPKPSKAKVKAGKSKALPMPRPVRESVQAPKMKWPTALSKQSAKSHDIKDIFRDVAGSMGSSPDSGAIRSHVGETDPKRFTPKPSPAIESAMGGQHHIRGIGGINIYYHHEPEQGVHQRLVDAGYIRINRDHPKFSPKIPSFVKDDPLARGLVHQYFHPKTKEHAAVTFLLPKHASGFREIPKPAASPAMEKEKPSPGVWGPLPPKSAATAKPELTDTEIVRAYMPKEE